MVSTTALLLKHFTTALKGCDMLQPRSGTNDSAQRASLGLDVPADIRSV